MSAKYLSITTKRGDDMLSRFRTLKSIGFTSLVAATVFLASCGDRESFNEPNHDGSAPKNLALTASTVPTVKKWAFPDSRPKTFKVDAGQERRLLNELPIRKRVIGQPPRPQPYTVIYIMDRFVLVCEYSDDTGELFYCDIYA
jgi:hypothetical protein